MLAVLLRLTKTDTLAHLTAASTKMLCNIDTRIKSDECNGKQSVGLQLLLALCELKKI
jgi:hypothetical protein